jgi:hypothetical protein
MSIESSSDFESSLDNRVRVEMIREQQLRRR